jgi:hypothetical protein
MLWIAEGKATGWEADRCPHVQVAELFSMEKFYHAEMDFLATTVVWKLPPK